MKLYGVITVFLVSIYANINHAYSQDAAKIENKFIQQLYLFDDKAGLTGAIYFTGNGNVIYYCQNFDGDTVRYLYGTYAITDKKITFQLTNEYYYHGKWDARWDVQDPDYKKGKSRKIKTQSQTLYKSKSDKKNFYRPYSVSEKSIAHKKHPGTKLSEVTIFPYSETPNMKFYSWLFKQIPVLANL